MAAWSTRMQVAYASADALSSENAMVVEAEIARVAAFADREPCSPESTCFASWLAIVSFYLKTAVVG